MNSLAKLNADSFDPSLGDVESEALSDHFAQPALISRHQKLTRIFQIGFNKCGTRSLYRFLQRCGIYSAHFNRGLLALRMHENIEAGRKPLHGKIDRFVAFTDIQRISMEGAIEGALFYKQLYQYYPNSYFILNTRDKEGWLRSRQRHGAGNYLNRYRKALGIASDDELLKYWSEKWDRHHEDVPAFFADKPDRLIVFDIKEDDPQKMCDFLSLDFETRPEFFRHEGDTASVDASEYEKNAPVKAHYDIL